MGCEGRGCMSNYPAGKERRGASQLEEEGRDLCHRPTILYPPTERDRQTDRNKAYGDVWKMRKKRSSQERQRKIDRCIDI